ncbi:MAG: hypothetical protein NWS68_03990 [Erythrobacter sp.]|nr:hypothetical protein [Erythrobacter sp.]
MSYSDHPNLSGWQKIGCAFYLIAAGFACLYAFAEVALRFDPPFLPRWLEYALFPGSLIAAMAGGALLLKYFKREKN